MRRFLTCTAIVAASFLAPSAPPARADQAALELRLVPAACHDPCNIRVRAFVQPDADNRSLALSAESASYLRRSIVPLDGANASRLHSMLFRELPAGTYTFEARVTRAASDDLIDARTVIVSGG